MAITLRELTGVATLALRSRTGEPGLDRAVRWAAPTELDDPTPWIDGGELILTTGLGQRSAAEQSAFVLRLAEAGVAGIGFATGLSHRAVPEATLAAARGVGLPVLEVPYETPFIAIARHVAEQFAAERLTDQRRLVDAHERLTQALLSADGLDQLLRILSRQTGAQVAVLVADGRTLAGRAPAEIAFDRGIDVAGVPVARLVAGPTTHPEALPYAAQLIGLELGRRLSLLGGRRFALGRLLRDLFEGRVRGEGAQWLLAAHGIHPGKPYRVLVGGWAEAPAATAPSSTAVSAVDVAASTGGRSPVGPAGVTVPTGEGVQRLSRLAWAVRQFDADGASAQASEPGRSIVSAIVEGRLVVLVPPGVDSDEQVRALWEALRRDPVRGASAVLGVGEPHSGATGIEYGYLEARTAASRGTGVRLAAPLSLSELLLSRPDQAVLGMSEQILEPLVRFDAEHGTALVATLRRFFATDGSVQQTAEELFVHRNTVRYRLQQIERLTGRTLASTVDRIELWLALRSVAAETEDPPATNP